MTKIVSSEEFQTQVLNSDKPVLVDFFATWCGPCKRVAPVVDEIAQEKAGKVDVVKLDIDQSPDIASKYGVMSVPTFILFEQGQPKKQILGAQPKAQLLEFIS
ncbi:MAG: thioredoxin [Raoultibacter sp.]|jgi:thioredoxin 1